MDRHFAFLQTVNSFFWNGPLLIFLLGTHIYFTFRTGFVQKKIPAALKLSVRSHTGSGGLGAFASLSTTLAATLGTGNIIGLSTAIAFGGPGAVFWCWITGVLGMATSYAECFLSLKYRETRPDGSFCGGPMYLLKNRLHAPKLARFYACLLLASAFCVGCSTQSRAVTETLHTLFDLPFLSTGICLALFITIALVGGIAGISTICSFLVPVMGGFFLISCVVLLFFHIDLLDDALKLILSSAVSTSSVTGGILGSSFLLAARQGIARGLFTNEAGLGSAPVAAANSSGTSREQALVLMSATFWDTVVMCGLTGLLVVSSALKGDFNPANVNSGELVHAAFSVIPFGRTLLNLSLCAFAVATLIGWYYIAEKAATQLSYLCYKDGTHFVTALRLFYMLSVFIGFLLSLDLIFAVSDLLNAVLTIPNVLLLYALRKEINSFCSSDSSRSSS